jgi:predicted flap endonuclease-1-like 5' DNA nuclease
VGPKLAGLLRAQGLTRFDQVAGLTASELERLDAHLGAFRGRLQRDRVVEQADYLARGDLDGFEERFGKL